MNILVSGANGGLGSVVSKKCVENGYRVFGISNSEELPFEDWENFMHESHDLMDARSAENYIRSLEEVGEQLDAAILTAGGFAMGSMDETSAKDIHDQIKLNFDTAYNLIQPLMKHFKKGGRIILIGAKQVFEPKQMQGVLAYSLAKKMLVNLSEVINAGYDKHGIDCTVIVPSIIDTEANREGMPDADFEKWVSPEQLADVIIYHLENPFVKQAVVKAWSES
ncbi:MAG: SDR family NAD(P)-dependent oxidoreductase [Cyclobacteriaceae bacterium]|nr:SDR family NAD(P)-dependent oxidoreductase [Cyclobacteriaceae bacterium]MCH8515886.1 SDR family NAD(P)-dependent oxidoreductase [Cyclobacteriaceae bacterium]